VFLINNKYEFALKVKITKKNNEMSNIFIGQQI